MANDPLSDALNTLKTHEIEGEPDCDVKASKLIRETLKIFQSRGYIGDFEFVDDGRSGVFKIKLSGKINNCGSVKPRFPVRKDEWKSWEERYLPGVGFGLLVVSTPEGLMTNDEARKRNIGGRLIAYVY